MNNNTDTRLSELESRFTYQDHLIQELNGVIIQQQQQIDQQAAELNRLRVQFLTIENHMQTPEEESPPPHY